MKNLFYLVIVALSIGAVFSLDSCKEDDPCEDIICLNGGKCVDGTCTECAENYYGNLCQDKCVKGTYDAGLCNCSVGYEGAVCDTAMREKFLGQWNVVETCEGIAQTYNYSMTAAISDDGILNFTLDNFRENLQDQLVTVLVDRNDSQNFLIEEQDFGNGQFLEGSGGFNSSGDTITIEYELRLSNGVEDCLMKLTK